MLCSKCGSTTNLQEHHTSYNPPEKIVLCLKCHQKEHPTHGVGGNNSVKGGSTYYLNCDSEEQQYSEYTCPKCGKTITSLYPRQFEQNKTAHMLTHKEAV